MERGRNTSAEQMGRARVVALACKEVEISEQRKGRCLRQEIFYSLKKAQTVIAL
ncbi:hypothetical protein AFFFEF_04799 [Methylorubrum extorquens]